MSGAADMQGGGHSKKSCSVAGGLSPFTGVYKGHEQCQTFEREEVQYRPSIFHFHNTAKDLACQTTI